MTPTLNSARSALWLGHATALAVLLVLVGWGIAFPIEGAILVHGRIEVERSRQLVQHPEGGVVAELLVREGDAVAAGALLLRLEPASLGHELTIIEARWFEAMARQGRLLAERDGLTAPLFPPELDLAAGRRDADRPVGAQLRQFNLRRGLWLRQAALIEAQRAQIRAGLAGIDAQTAAATELRRLLADSLQDQEALAQRGLADRQRLNALQRELAQMDGRLGELDSARAAAGERMIEAGLRLAQAEDQRIEDAMAELRQLEPQLEELAERRRQLRDRLSALDIRAPVAGTVHGLQIQGARSVVRPAEPLLHLVPRGRPLVAVLLVPAEYIRRIHLGQRVELQLSGAEGRHSDRVGGRIARISGDAVTAEGQGPGYRTELHLDAQPEAAPELLPGMPVEAFILTGARPAAELLLAPLTGYFDRALRG